MDSGDVKQWIYFLPKIPSSNCAISAIYPSLPATTEIYTEIIHDQALFIAVSLTTESTEQCRWLNEHLILNKQEIAMASDICSFQPQFKQWKEIKSALNQYKL